MATSTTVSAASASSRVMQLVLAAICGIFITGFVGFSHIEAVHNAGHDYRHSMAFPCH
ncbi:MAG: CbtB-domain containing protein [Rhizobiaceae bacterium]